MTAEEERGGTGEGLEVGFLRENKGKFSSTRVRVCSSAMVARNSQLQSTNFLR